MSENKSIYILGISSFYHDSAACLLKDGVIIGAIQEERLSRKKNDASFPIKAINYLFEENNIKPNDVDYIVFYDKPYLKFERLLETYLAYAPVGFKSFMKAMPLWINQKLWVESYIRRELNFEGQVLFTEHHESHAASAFFPSPFKEAAILTIDGVGEWATASYGIGQKNKLEISAEMHFPHSLGLLYSAFTYFLGFQVNEGEYKVMGLAPYGEAKYKDIILKELIDLKEDGSFQMDMKYFNYCAGLTMTNDRFANLFGISRRIPEEQIQQEHMDMAKSIQEVTEEIVLKMSEYVYQQTGQTNLCLAGGVALNCVGNGRILREGSFENIWIQPAAGDSGGALGAALAIWHHYLEKPRSISETVTSQSCYLGPKYDNNEIRNFLDTNQVRYQYLEDGEILEKVADCIAEENVIGWFQGRMEFGPRALGARSIIGDARSPKMQEIMNLKIKFRESFRPFAPAIKQDRVSEFFELEGESPYMLIVAPVKDNVRRELDTSEKSIEGFDKLNINRSEIPAVTHVDYSARIQTVSNEESPLFYSLLTKLEQKYQCPVVINTSFNIRGEPIVCSPEDAYRCFMRTNMDYLVLGNYLISKKDQSLQLSSENWAEVFELAM